MLQAGEPPGDDEEAEEDALEVPEVLLAEDDAAVLRRLDVLRWRKRANRTSQ